MNSYLVTAEFANTHSKSSFRTLEDAIRWMTYLESMQPIMMSMFYVKHRNFLTDPNEAGD